MFGSLHPCVLLTVNPASQAVSPQAPMTDDQRVILAIAADIEKLGNEFHQLGEFKAATNAHPEGPAIHYAFHTHEPERRVGWAGGAPSRISRRHLASTSTSTTAGFAGADPHPAGDGEPLPRQEARVSLILEGEGTNSVAGRIHAILTAHMV